MYLAREGIQSVIVEREEFPRYHIGESMSGECGAILRDLGLGEEMARRGHPIKNGVEVFGKNAWYFPVMGRDEAGKLFPQATWQVRRSEFDRVMLDEAVRCGATLVPGQATAPLLGEEGEVQGVRVRLSDETTADLECEMLLDCSGQATFLANAGVTGPKYVGNYDKQIAVFSQVVGADRATGDSRASTADDTLIFYKGKYHWAWWIPLDDEVISVGVVIPAAYFVEKRQRKRKFLLRELHELHPELARRLSEIRLVDDVRVIKNYSYQVRGFCGKGFACIGDAHRFIDPIFSFGLYLTVREAQLAAPAVRDYLEGAHRDDPNPLAAHQIYCERGIDVIEDMIDTFWEHPFAFGVMVHRRLDDIIDVFAGRTYEGQPSEGVRSFRKLLARERTYESDEYSVPIGSRFHPELARLWEAEPSYLAELDDALAT